jgi:N6-adenosine-specific RNA methylase IME4
MGNLPRVELFARQKSEGWNVWGNEVECDIDLTGGEIIALADQNTRNTHVDFSNRQ